ncbi:hypothetical protein ACFY1U_23100 [Streptomyces sp. NPDC001351]|uniref:hypothetical protein n=1 Tax=Streptomyces sp. NPDC001351 TaxID=3364564 RepID=UPI0036C0452D
MAVDQLPGRVREFVNYLNGLLARLDQGGGWCAVFWQRDPDGMRACLEGREVPPWDVVEALLHDLAAEFGAAAAGQEKERARGLHAAALAAHDARPGGRDALGDRLDVMLREQRYAAERQAELGRRLAAATTRQEADALRLDLAWARDDHERATARCAELRARMADLDSRTADGRAAAIRRARIAEGAVYRIDREFAPDEPPPTDLPTDEGEPPGPGFPHQRGSHDSTAADGHRGPYEPDGPHPAHSHGGGPTWARSGAYGQGVAEGQQGGPYEAAASARGYDPYGPAGAGQGPAGARAEVADGQSGARGASPHRGPFEAARPVSSDGGSPRAPEQRDAHATPSGAAQPAPEPPAPKQRKRRRGGARFAGMVEEETAPVALPPTAVPAPKPTGRTPRGARFAGAAEVVERPQQPRQPQAEPLDTAGPREVVGAVERLVRLRAEGRSGEAHALLVDAAHWPAARFPLLAAELQRAGLGADWATLLWEAASLPADRLVAAADALVAAGRADDGDQMLRQGVARPAAEIGQAVLALAGEGRDREVRALLDAYVRVRTPEEAARSAEPDPRALVPLLLEAAQGVSEERHWDLVHALRVAGFTA